MNKAEIKKMFEEKCERLGLSQERAAVQAGSKGSTVSAVFSGKYGADDTAIYKLLAAWVGYDENWRVVPTRNFQFVTRTLDEARKTSEMFMLIGDAGCGKSEAQKQYAQSNKNSFRICCDEFWGRNEFIAEILKQMGKSGDGYNLAQKVDLIASTLIQLERPLLMIDEFDKLSNQVIHLLIGLYNRLEGRCGITISATDHLEQRFQRGLKFNRKGYKELWSRCGRKPIQLLKTTEKDVKMVCLANGIDNDFHVSQIISECEGDMRRIKRYKQKMELDLATAA